MNDDRLTSEIDAAQNVARIATFQERKCPAVGGPPEGPSSRTFGHFKCRTGRDISRREERNASPTGRKKRGPYKFTPQAQARFCSALELGLSRARAARHAGVSVRTVERAIQRDREFAAQVARIVRRRAES